MLLVITLSLYTPTVPISNLHGGVQRTEGDDYILNRPTKMCEYKSDGRGSIFSFK